MLNTCILLVLVTIIIIGSWFLAYLIKRFKKLHLATELGGLFYRERAGKWGRDGERMEERREEMGGDPEGSA